MAPDNMSMRVMGARERFATLILGMFHSCVLVAAIGFEAEGCNTEGNVQYHGYNVAGTEANKPTQVLEIYHQGKQILSTIK